MKLNQRITRTALLLALAIAVQQFRIQGLTGPAINAILILTIAYVDVYAAAIVGSVTPILAVINGIMPLAIVAPFIIIANIVYVFSYNWQYKNNKFSAIALSAILKYAVLAIAVTFIIEVPPPVAYALTTPQLFTAVSGGIIGTIIIKYLPLENALEETEKKNIRG